MTVPCFENREARWLADSLPRPAKPPTDSCGMELTGLDRCGIFLKLSSGDDLKKTGTGMPFMVIFDGLPSAATEYRIEPSGPGPLK